MNPEQRRPRGAPPKIAPEEHETVRRRALFGGRSHRELASLYGVTPRTIFRILQHRRISQADAHEMLGHLKALYTEFGGDDTGRLIHQIDPAWPNPHGAW